MNFTASLVLTIPAAFAVWLPAMWRARKDTKLGRAPCVPHEKPAGPEVQSIGLPVGRKTPGTFAFTGGAQVMRHLVPTAATAVMGTPALAGMAIAYRRASAARSAPSGSPQDQSAVVSPGDFVTSW